MKYACPKCSSDHLAVDVTVSARLYQYEDGNFETEPAGDHEWDETSHMTCLECGHVDEAHLFDTENNDDTR